MDQLQKFHKQHGVNLNRFPSVDKRPLDLYKLKKAVETRGGFEKVCKGKKWAEIGRDLGYSGKIMSSLSTSLKNSFQKWLFPYEEYLRIAKPAVQQQLEFEYGGPFTPSSAGSPMKRPHQDTPTSLREDSPAVRASVALNVSLQASEEPNKNLPLVGASAVCSPPPPPMVSSGFTAVNTGGFTAVNMTPASFQAVNAPTTAYRQDTDNGTLANMAPHPTPNTAQTQDANGPHGSAPAPVVQSNGNSSNPLKRTISHESPVGGTVIESDPGADNEDENGRRSKRLKKGSPRWELRHLLLWGYVLTDYASSTSHSCGLSHEYSPSIDSQNSR